MTDGDASKRGTRPRGMHPGRWLEVLGASLAGGAPITSGGCGAQRACTLLQFRAELRAGR